MIIVNIYWGDLSESGQDTLINGGFVVNEMQRQDKKPIGVIKTDTNEHEEAAKEPDYGCFLANP